MLDKCCRHADSLLLNKPNGEHITLAGANTTTDLAGINGAQFGRTVFDQNTSVLSTTGGSSDFLSGDFVLPGESRGSPRNGPGTGFHTLVHASNFLAANFILATDY